MARFLKARDLAARYGWGRSKVYELARAGKIPVIRVGAQFLIPEDKLLAWEAANTVDPLAADSAGK